MPLPSARLDLVVLPREPDVDADPDLLWSEGVARGWWTVDGLAGPAAAELVQGGFERVRTESHPRARLVANQQGGFGVHCPACERSLVPAFQQAAVRYREGGPRLVSCPHCAWAGDLDDLDFRPPAAFGRVALHIGDVQGPAPEPEAVAHLTEVWGPVRWVARRVG